MKENYCNCLAFYEWQGDIDVVQWHELAKRFFLSINVVPDLATCDGMEKNAKPFAAGELDAKLRNKNSSKIKSVNLLKSKPGYKQLVFGWRVLASLNTSRGKTMLFCFDDEFHHMNKEFVESFVKELCNVCNPIYGIAYARDFSKGPDMYAYGMSVGLDYSQEEMKESDVIGSWMNERLSSNRHVVGMLRDVYKMNFISKIHLQQLVDGQSLEDWITAKNNGKLITLSNELVCWIVPDNIIKNVREKLIKNSLLIAS